MTLYIVAVAISTVNCAILLCMYYRCHEGTISIESIMKFSVYNYYFQDSYMYLVTQINIAANMLARAYECSNAYKSTF